MIEWLSDWIKQIVILVLIATFLDLLLPNNALERYVKLVMGLLIILAMLVPIFDLLQRDWDFSDFTVERAARTDRLDPLHKIKQDGETLAGTREGLAREEVEQQLAASIRSAVSEQFKLEVGSVNLQFQVDANGVVKGIDQVQIALHPEAEAKENNRQSIVEEVDPVNVELDKQREPSPQDPEPDKRSAAIAAFVAEKWEVPVEQVHVTVEDGW